MLTLYVMTTSYEARKPNKQILWTDRQTDTHTHGHTLKLFKVESITFFQKVSQINKNPLSFSEFIHFNTLI